MHNSLAVVCSGSSTCSRLAEAEHGCRCCSAVAWSLIIGRPHSPTCFLPLRPFSRWLGLPSLRQLGSPHGVRVRVRGHPAVLLVVFLFIGGGSVQVKPVPNRHRELGALRCGSVTTPQLHGWPLCCDGGGGGCGGCTARAGQQARTCTVDIAGPLMVLLRLFVAGGGWQVCPVGTHGGLQLPLPPIGRSCHDWIKSICTSSCVQGSCPWKPSGRGRLIIAAQGRRGLRRATPTSGGSQLGERGWHVVTWHVVRSPLATPPAFFRGRQGSGRQVARCTHTGWAASTKPAALPPGATYTTHAFFSSALCCGGRRSSTIHVLPLTAETTDRQGQQHVQVSRCPAPASYSAHKTLRSIHGSCAAHAGCRPGFACCCCCLQGASCAIDAGAASLAGARRCSLLSQ